MLFTGNPAKVRPRRVRAPAAASRHTGAGRPRSQQQAPGLQQRWSRVPAPSSSSLGHALAHLQLQTKTPLPSLGYGQQSETVRFYFSVFMRTNYICTICPAESEPPRAASRRVEQPTTKPTTSPPPPPSRTTKLTTGRAR